MIGQGVSSRSSHSAAAGRITSLANSCTQSRTCTTSSGSSNQKPAAINEPFPSEGRSGPYRHGDRLRLGTPGNSKRLYTEDAKAQFGAHTGEFNAFLACRSLARDKHAFSILNMRSADMTAAARIRGAAIEQFGHRGFNVGLRAIADAAGVSAALVIHHFGSKQGLRKACDDHVAEEIRSAKSEPLRSADPAH